MACTVLLAVLAPGLPAAQNTDPAKEKRLIAVLELGSVGASAVEVSAISDRLREELLNSGRFTLVDRSQMDAILTEQALQQTGCTEAECAVQVGQVLGVRNIVAGKVTKISDQVWLVSATMIDVETAETLRAESIRFKGDFFSLIDVEIVQLAYKLAAAKMPEPVARSEDKQPAAKAEDSTQDERTKLQKCKDAVTSPVLIGAYLVGFTTSGASGLSTTGVYHLIQLNDCKKLYGITAREFQQLHFVINGHEAVSEDIAHGGGPALSSLSALLGCPEQTHAQLAVYLQQEFVHVQPRHDAAYPDIDLLLGVKRRIAARPGAQAGCAYL